MNNKYCVIITTFDNEIEANNIIKNLLEKKLVACCQKSIVNSFYKWKGNIENSEEILVQMKTKKSLYKNIENEIKNLHSYETPEIISYDITNGSKEYLEWIEEETI